MRGKLTAAEVEPSQHERNDVTSSDFLVVVISDFPMEIFIFFGIFDKHTVGILVVSAKVSEWQNCA